MARRIAVGALGLVFVVGCSQSPSSPVEKPGTGGNESGGAGGSGGSAGSGGLADTGGTTTAGGGSKGDMGGSTAGAGGSTTSSGGSASGGRSGTGGRSTTGRDSATGGRTAVTGGAGGFGGSTTGPAQGGAGGGSTGTPDASATGSRDGGGASDTGGSSGGAGGTLSGGCGKAVTRPNRRTQQTIDIGGTPRYYLLNVPSDADNTTPLPLVFALHGYDMNNIALVDLYDFTKQSGNKAITVLPQGEGPEPGTTSHWGDQVLKSTWSGNAANYTFIQTLMADIEDRYCVDTSRVFITGFSMGGMFTNALACEHNDWFRGYAPVEGGGPNACANADAKPSVIIHQGTLDTIAKPTAGEGTRDFWTKQNGCSSTTSSVYTGCESYGDCDAPVIYCVGAWDHTVSSTARANIWSFFDSLQ